jgi:hypothetical protein
MAENERYGRLPGPGEKVSGLSRGSIYNLAAKNPGLLKKAGSASILDLNKLDRVIAELPDAQITSGLASHPTTVKPK